MTHDFIVEPGTFGPRLVPRSAWRHEMADYMRREQITELYLNTALGWRGETLNFLESVPELTGLKVLDLSLRSDAPVHTLQHLRALNLQTYCRTPIRFDQFSMLEHCVFYWRPKSESPFDSIQLQHLFLYAYPGKQSEAFSLLAALEHLEVVRGRFESLVGLRTLTNLRFLGLYYCPRVTSLLGIEQLATLEDVRINNCKAISSLELLSNLKRLKFLQLDDDGHIESISPLAQLQALETALLCGSTIVTDGDMSPLARLPNLTNVSFGNRRHYSLKVKDLEQRRRI